METVWLIAVWNSAAVEFGDAAEKMRGIKENHLKMRIIKKNCLKMRIVKENR